MTAAALARARERLAAGDLAAAEAGLAAALRANPRDADLHYLHGVVAARRGESEQSIASFLAALAARPGMAPAWLALGHARMRRGDSAAAVEAYERAATLEPAAADAHFNLGIAHRRLDDLPAAARDFWRAWLRDPTMVDAARGCVGTLGRLARSGLPAPAQAPLALPPRPPAIGVVVCSIDEAKAARVHALYTRLLAGVPHEVLVLRDARSLAEAYNRGVAAVRGDIVVLSHDDIDLLAADFAARVARHLETFDVLGTIGGTLLTGPLPVWAGHPHLRGWIVHRAGPAAPWLVDGVDPRVVAGGMVVLDGVLLAGRREVFARVPFDSATFDGFHGYDIDWSYRVASAGYRLASAGDLRVVHASRGRFDATWERYAARFCAKHGLAPADPGPPPFYETALGSREEVGWLFDWLAGIAGEDGATT